MISLCEECGKSYDKNHARKKYCSSKCRYRAKDKRRLAKNPRHDYKKHLKRKKYIMETIISPAKTECFMCGFKDKRALEFHHRNPKDKSFELSTWKAHSEKEIKAEILKCDVVCANCHRIIHSQPDPPFLLL